MTVSPKCDRFQSSFYLGTIIANACARARVSRVVYNEKLFRWPLATTTRNRFAVVIITYTTTQLLRLEHETQSSCRVMILVCGEHTPSRTFRLLFFVGELPTHMCTHTRYVDGKKLRCSQRLTKTVNGLPVYVFFMCLSLDCWAIRMRRVYSRTHTHTHSNTFCCGHRAITADNV